MSKKDVVRVIKEIKKDRCVVISLNADKQATSDFYVVKNLDGNRILKHIKTQLRDLNGDTHVYDFDITYSNGKAVFKGSVKVFHWELDNPPIEDPNGPPVYPDPDPPTHPVEMVELRDNRSFEVLFDRRTGYATNVRYSGEPQPELKLLYDGNGKLLKVNAYQVDMDSRGNIKSVLMPAEAGSNQRLGVEYVYNLDEKHKRHYYESPFIFVHHFYSLLEVLDWGPFQPASERIAFSIRYAYFPDELPPYIPDQVVYGDYSNHKYDQNGNLVSYDFDGDLSSPIPYFRFQGHRSRNISWTCSNNPK